MTANRFSVNHPSDLRHEAPVAVVDVGSNSVRLVVYETAGRSPIPVFNERALCGLGRGLGQRGSLPDAAVEHAHATLERFAALCHAMEVTHVHAIATAAVREAENGEAFVREAEQRWATNSGSMWLGRSPHLSVRCSVGLPSSGRDYG